VRDPKTNPQAVTPSQVNNINDLEQKEAVTGDLFVTAENATKPLENNDCDGVTAGRPDSGVTRTKDPESEAVPVDQRAATEQQPICAQCHALPDGQERQCQVGNTTVWLHPECERFYSETEDLP
jgi:hypothetical protein